MTDPDPDPDLILTQAELTELGQGSIATSTSFGVRVRWIEAQQLFVFDAPRLISATRSPETLIKLIKLYSLQDRPTGPEFDLPQDQKQAAAALFDSL